ncbi:MAG: sodium:alanine symporter family protein [Ruminococcaceae bacterium]|nr:sodium:alanine symporter family protein [Oscillospiraceae bacterium]
MIAKLNEIFAPAEKLVATVNSWMTDYLLLFLLVGIGLFYTIRTRFVQVRCFGQGMKQVFGGLSLKGGKQKGGLSSFQALATAIAAQVGTGNIVGACGAILIGGPGAIFWMWVIAFLGMATIYAEAVLAQKTRVVDADGNVQGGPVYYIRSFFKGGFGKFLAGFFAVAVILALGFMGSMVQSNSIGESVGNVFGWQAGTYQWIIGLVVAVLAAVIFLGGVNRIAAVTEKMVPIMAGLYILGSLVVIFARITYVPAAFGMIFKYAFNANALIGGGIGYALKTALSQGAKRGLFSNEAGMGSTPHAHAQANVKTPHEQGVSAMIGVFIDTFIVLTMTALVVISTLYAGGPLGVEDGTYQTVVQGFAKTNLAQRAFGVVFGETFGNIFVAVCLFFFAFSTILSWNFFGKINAEYLFGKKGVKVYTVLAVVFIFAGSLFSNRFVWELTDFFNYLMVIPNVIALVCLGSLVAASAKTNGKCDLPAESEETVAEEKTEETVTEETNA